MEDSNFESKIINLPISDKDRKEIRVTLLALVKEQKNEFLESLKLVGDLNNFPEDKKFMDSLYYFTEKVGIKEDDVDIREQVELPGNGILMSDFADKVASKLKDKDELFFRSDLREVVEITELGFNIIKPNRFITVGEKYFRPLSTVNRKDGGSFLVEKSMNQQTASIVLSSPNFQDNIKLIKRLFSVPMPIIYENELTVPKKGYDKRFSSWTDLKSPQINNNIELSEAKGIFKKIFGEFCFQSEQDYTNAIAALITPFLRGLFTAFNVRTPMFCYMANRERAGKDYCAGITGLLLEGYNSEEPPISSGEHGASGMNDELRKKLVSALIAGKKRFHSANNKGKLNNAVLEGFLTSPIYTDRILGRNETPIFDNEMDVSISGNIGMSFTADLANRARFINLFLDIEDANQRKFNNPNLHKWVMDNREYIISCIFSLIKNWISVGKPDGSIPFASFPEWAAICGGIMESAELGNPCVRDKINQGVSLDNETDEMKILFEYVIKKVSNKWISKDELKQIIAESDEGIFSWIDWSNKSHQTIFGQKLNKFVGRILSDIRLTVKDKSQRTQRWKYKFTKENNEFLQIEEKENTKVRDLLIEIVKEKDSVCKSELFEIINFNGYDIKEDELSNIIENLLERGVIFEPRKDHYRYL